MSTSKDGASQVVITGVGLVTALGTSVDTVWPRLLAGQDGTGPVSRFPTEGYRVQRACEVIDLDPTAVPDLTLDISMRAAKEAAAGADILPLDDPGRAGLMFGTMGSGLNLYEERVRAGGSPKLDRSMAEALLPGQYSSALANTLGCEGRVGSMLTACSAGNQALALGRRWIASGHADVMFVGGGQILTQTQYTHFHNLRALSPDVCRPFDRSRRGLVIGEGAAFLVLESERHAKRRGANILAKVLGAAASSDGHHMTAPDPSGDGAWRAITGALTDAGVGPNAVDYVSAHGTGTPWNERVEAQVVRLIFGRNIPASSIKSMIGHCMGGASAIESVICVLALRDQVVPPTAHFQEPDPECPIDCVPNPARALSVRVTLNISFALGGNNCVVVLGAYDS
jgi:3-oxoacyl-[acyl-carrier-protein] synthase II